VAGVTRVRLVGGATAAVCIVLIALTVRTAGVALVVPVSMPGWTLAAVALAALRASVVFVCVTLAV